MQRTVIDERYTLTRLLGSGGMAQVYLAHDEVLDRDVALKVLRDQYADDEEFVERFRREARSAAKLTHPNIVSVYDQGRSEDGAYYMAMEYVSKGTLKDRVKRDGALAPDAAVGVALQIADALSAAHEKGVIHRDIKPQNVLVTDSGDVKVADFGIARAASSTATATGIVLGTAGYMSPEQAKGEPVGPRSDLYSLGVVLYEMLTGNLPYEAESDIAVAMKHITEPPYSPREANPEVSEALNALTMKLLAKDPENRYPSADALVNDLERVRSGLPPSAASSEKTQALTAPLPPGVRGRPRKQADRPTAVSPVRLPASPPAGGPGRGGRSRGRISSLLVTLLFAIVLLGGLALALSQFGLPDLGGSDDSTNTENTTPMVTVPDLHWSLEAETALANENLRLGSSNWTPSDTVPVNVVVYSDPEEGTEVEEGTVVDIYVSSGPGQQQSPPPSPAVLQVAPVSQAAPAPPVLQPAPVDDDEDGEEKDKKDKKKEKEKGKGKAKN